MTRLTTKKRFIDPVCGIKVSPKTASAKTEYKGRQIYFCAQSCKKAFDAKPSKYKLDKPKGLWDRYLARLNKSTGGRPPSCCS